MRDTEHLSPSSASEPIHVSLGAIELLAEVQELAESLFDHHAACGAAGLPVQSREATWKLRLAHYERLFERQPAFSMVARQGVKAVGYVVAYADDPIDEVGEGPVVTVESLVVAPELHGQGLGGWLLEEAEAEAIEQWGAELSALEVIVGNESAENFCTRAGFAPRGETWFRPAPSDTPRQDLAIDDDRLEHLLDQSSDAFAFGLEEGPDDTWQSSIVLLLCQPEPGTAADEVALEAALAPFAEAGAYSVFVALDQSNDAAWRETLTAAGFRRALRLLTRSITVE